MPGERSGVPPAKAALVWVGHAVVMLLFKGTHFLIRIVSRPDKSGGGRERLSKIRLPAVGRLQR